MRRFFVNPEDIINKEVHIKDADAHHISQVLRLKEGEKIIVFTGTGLEYLVVIKNITTGLVSGDILSVTSSQRDSQVHVTLVQGIPKGDKMDLIIQKCTEVGIARIIPVLTERTVVKLDKDKQKKRQDRWQKIAQEASKQCQRATVPQIEEICTWPQYFLRSDLLGPTLVLWENESNYGLKTFLKENSELDHINLVIGPEGGLSTQEVERLLSRGARSVTLGSRILRTETAGLAALVMVLYELGDLG